MGKNEIFTALQKKVLREFGKTSLKDKFYFTGGTCLAARYLRHRLSEDLDFFSYDLIPDEIILSEAKKMKDALKIKNVKHKKILNRMQFFFLHGKESVKLEFVYFPFSNIIQPKIWKDYGIRANSLIDIATDKVLAALERNDPKDCFDLYFLIRKKKLPLEDLINNVKKKFGVEIDIVTLNAKIFKNCELLAKIEPLMLQKKEKDLIQKIKDTFQKISNSYLNLILL